MSINRINKLISLGLFFLVAIIYLCPLFDLCAEENDSSSKASDYRQKLDRMVVVEEEFYSQDLDNYIRYLPSRGVAAQSGKVAVVDSAMEYSYTIKAFDQLPVEFALGTKYIGITNTTAVELPAHLTTIFIGAETTLPFFNIKNTYFTIGLAPVFDADNWSIRSSALCFTQRYFFIYQLNNKLILIAGVSVTPHEEDAVMPLLGFIYKPNDRLTFNITPKQPEISYVLTKKLTIFGQADVTMNEYRVAKDGVKNTALIYNEIHAGVGLRCKVNKHILGSVSVGEAFNRSIKYRDYYGKVVVNNGMYAEFRVDIRI